MESDIKRSVNIFELITRRKPVLMGILNVTPDSFSDAGKYLQISDAIVHAEELIKSGVDIVDVGGESTRPGAALISEEEEFNRVIPIVSQIKKKLPEVFISIDTYKSKVAECALTIGAKMINDVSGLTIDPNMVQIASKFNCQIVIMHNKGIPATKPTECGVRNVECGMNQIRNPQSAFRIIDEVYKWLQEQTEYAIANGVKRENIIIDPGIGFGKTANEDLELVKNLREFKSLGFPLLVGLSRKSFIRKLFGDTDIEKKSQELCDFAVKNGADILRVHSVSSL